MPDIIEQLKTPEKNNQGESTVHFKKEGEKNIEKKEIKVVEKPKEIPKPVIKTRMIVNKAFKVGEKLTFALQWLGITAGIATIEVNDIVNINGKKAYHIVTTAKALPIIAAVHRVEDTVVTYIDCDGIFSRKMTKSLREGNYERDVTLIYDQDKNLVKEVEKTDVKVYNIPDYCQDILSSFFYFRTQNIAVGNEIIVDVYADGKSHKLKVKIEKEENIRIPLGKYKAFAIKPFMEFESIFSQKGDVTIWCTQDAKHVPLLMRSKVFIGSVDAKLIDAVIPE